MGRRTTATPLRFSHHRRRRTSPGSSSTEYYGNPSGQALRAFNHVLAIGRARLRPGREMRQQPRAGYLLHFVSRGTYWHRIGGREFSIGEGGACLLELGNSIEQGTGGPGPTDLWWVYFNGREAPGFFAELRADRDPAFPHLPRRRLHTLLRQLQTIMARRPVAHEVRAHVVLAAILAELFIARAHRSDAARIRGSESALSERIQAAADYMARRVHERIGLKDIAADVGLNMYYFAQRFRDEVGMPPIRYLSGLRVEQAKRLLTTTNEPIAKISAMVGIADPDYFARLFRKLVGVSPRSYRSMNPRRDR